MSNNRLIVTFCTILLLAFQIIVAPSGNKTSTQSDPPVRGVRGDLWADIVLGKPDFYQMGVYEVTGSRVFNPGGVIVDRSVTPNRLYVYDGGNSRVLGLHIDASTSSGSRAELVLGQPGLDGYSACNGDSNFHNYPQRALASASTLCSMPELTLSPREGGSFANMAVDANGNLYVPDFINHRVLLYISPFETDTIADDVWGQADFSGNECNQGRDINQSDASSLCLRSIWNEGFVGGVGLDSANNLWVTDNQNNRVLRFPYDPNTGRAAHVANLVLGQPDFVTDEHGLTMNKMWAPAAVRVSAAGSVYVADSLNNRILVFNPPFSNGMTASSTFGANLRLPTSIEFDQDGNTWVSDSGNYQVLRFTAARVVDRVLLRDVPTYTGNCGGNYTNDGPPFNFPGPPSGSQESVTMCDSRGSIGIDSGGNVWVTGSSFTQDVRRYPAPFPVIKPGVAHSADVELFQGYSPGESNAITERGLADPRGIAIGANQLIVSDGSRILFWNNAPDSLTNGKAADGVLIAPNFNVAVNPPIGLVRTDAQNRLWVMRSNTISVYQLPLKGAGLDTPIHTLTPPVAVKGSQGTISWDSNLDTAGMAITSNGDYLWLADPDHNRAIRIAAPLTNPVVDVVLGQLNTSGSQCNQGRGKTYPSANSLCYPANVVIDPAGNIFVSDFALEDNGNYRLLEYDASLFPASPAAALFGIPASRVYGTNGSFTTPGCTNEEADPLCKPLEPAFNQWGQMVIGRSGYTGKYFPLIYQDPLVNPLPIDTLKDFYSMPYATYYDSADNLYVADRNRGRLLIYLAEPNGTRTPTPTPAKTNTPTPTSTGTPTVAKTVTPTSTLIVQTFNSIAAQDGWVLESSETGNKGGSMNNTGITLRLGDDAANRQYRSILSFNTGSLPDNAVITGVTLKVKQQAILGSGNPVTTFGGFMVDIKNGAFGAAALQINDFQAAVSKSYGPFLRTVLVNNWYGIDLTTAGAFVNKLATNSGLTQIRLRFKLDDNNNASANVLSLYSGNPSTRRAKDEPSGQAPSTSSGQAASAANRPQLVITYYVP